MSSMAISDRRKAPRMTLTHGGHGGVGGYSYGVVFLSLLYGSTLFFFFFFGAKIVWHCGSPL